MRARRAGFTLAEVIISMTLLAIIGAAAVPFYLRSLRSVAATAGQQDAQQAASFSLDFVNHDLRLAGQGVVNGQPAIVQMHDSAVTFNANLVTRDTSAATTGAYVDPSVNDSLAMGMMSTKTVKLPLTTQLYPLTTYYQTAGVLSDAETISFWVAKDTTTGAVSGTYALYRRVNTNAPQLVARDIVFRGAGTDPAPFQYFVADPNFPNAVVPVKSVTTPHPYPFPLNWTTGIGNDTLLENIITVRMSLTFQYTNPITKKITYRTVNEDIPLENGGLPNYSACPGPPAPPTGMQQYVATANTSAAKDSVIVSWNKSTDEAGGFKNVRFYMVYRKLDTATTWGTVLSTLTAFDSTRDTLLDYPPLLTAPRYYIYGVVAENCTPQVSTVLQTTTPIFPNP
ncbi:MAG TPA: prepilin-type N-terminal cleavage/methylation domain-containing protein [Gemmatimonadaceae bacterium]|jgi:prepilin-type N-terminal cleavage/methylation domain-containing protein|nr:prepilin-type N-terminal cleavage/methylation domain-containing protein [Gemmatimonadaceae bacterium]